jgi:vanillate O-demethylase monooxygenase subunit
MPFLKNVWYVAGYAKDFDRKPVSRRICNELLVLFRDAKGKACVMQDRCPHRFVPLSMGRVEERGLRCGYHGLLFDGTGKCVELPNDDGASRPEIRVRSYPAVEKHGAVWIWMGEPERATPETIPDFPFVTSKEYSAVMGYSHVKANHEMITDNLLDLSHVHYLHADSGASPKTHFSNFENRVEQDGNTVWSMLWQKSYEPQPFLKYLWGSQSTLADGTGHVRWDPPSVLYAQRAITEVGRPMAEGIEAPTAHFITPETETTTHYFWVIGRTAKIDDTALDQQIRELGGKVFDTEDCPMIAAQQEAMGEATDFLTQSPIILKADAAGVRARLVMKKLLKAEQAAALGLETQPREAETLS